MTECNSSLHTKYSISAINRPCIK